MVKIALIEDVYSRQKDLLNKNGFNLDDYKDIVENFVCQKADKLLHDIISDNFDLDEYDIIIAHKSVQTKDENDTNTIIIDRLTKFCQEKGKTLVLFSGGIGANYHKEKYLELNSQTFYSQNLKTFLEALRDAEENILMLCYGFKWKLNILLNTLEKLNYALEKSDNEPLSYRKFTKDYKLNLLTNLGLEFKIPEQKNKISIQEIKEYKDTIYSSIKESIIYE